jgi:acyl carrier protein
MKTHEYLRLIETFFGNDTPVNLDSPLTQLVTDSFLLVELVIHLQEEADALVHREAFESVVTVADLIAVVEAGRHAHSG